MGLETVGEIIVGTAINCFRELLVRLVLCECAVYRAKRRSANGLEVCTEQYFYFCTASGARPVRLKLVLRTAPRIRAHCSTCRTCRTQGTQGTREPYKAFHRILLASQREDGRRDDLL
jgi:hypothetical protein